MKLCMPVLFCAVAAAALIEMTPASAQDTKPYRVAVIAAKTGVLATVLGPAGTGFEAYIDKINKAGGVNGRQIKLDLFDEQSTPSVANGLFQRVLADPPIAIAFFGQSTSQTQSRQLLENAGLPTLTVTADDSFLYPKPTKTMFQVSPSAFQQAQALIAVAGAKVGDLKGKKIATVSVQTTFSDALVKNIETIGKQMGFEIVTSERFPAGIPSFASQAAKIARLAPDAILVLAGNADGPLVIKAISDAGVTTAPIVGYAAISSNEIFQKASIPNYFAFRSSNVASEMPEVVSTVQGTPFSVDLANSWWSNGWVAASLLTQGLQKCGATCDGTKLIAALESLGPVNVPGGLLFGPLSYSADNHAGLTIVQAYKWDGKAVVKDGAPLDTANVK